MSEVLKQRRDRGSFVQHESRHEAENSNKTKARTRQQKFCLEEPQGEAIASRTTSMRTVKQVLLLNQKLVILINN